MSAARPPTMLLTYKYRLNPEARQHRALEAILEQQRQLYNAALEERILAWRMAGKSISEVEQSRSLTLIRADDPAFAAVQRRIQRATLKRLDRAYKAFFRRAKAGAGASSGFPKFKGRTHFDGFAFDAFAQVRLDGNGLRFAGMPGKLRFWRDRPLPEVPDPETGELGIEIKNVWFKRGPLRLRAGRLASSWYVGFQVEVMPKPRRANRKAIGVDWGTSVLAALSTGETLPNPRFAEIASKALSRRQRSLARKRKGSKRRLKQRLRLRALQNKIANRRRNRLDKVSARLVQHFDTIAAENIEAAGLMDAERPGETLPEFVKVRRNREALEAAPYLLRQMLAYKAERDGAQLIIIDPKNTTQLCSLCGGLHFKELSEMRHFCPVFGTGLPRKLNAARVILQSALGLVPGTGGGSVPEGAAQAANGGSGLRRPGKTEGGQPPPGRRSSRELLPHMHGPPPKPPPGRRRTAPS